MYFLTTALGRTVPEGQIGTVLEDLILKVLFDYRMSPFNASNTPMALSALAKAAMIDEKLALAFAEALSQKGLVEKHPQKLMGKDAFRISGTGVVEVHNVPQGVAGAV